MWNFMEAEADILDRLRANTQTGPGAWARFVGTRADLATVAEEMQKCPAIYLVYDGFVVNQADGNEAVMNHRWLVVVAVAHAADLREASPRNQEAGLFLGAILTLLHGYTPKGCTGELIPTTPPRPYYSEARFAYFPLAFTCQLRHTRRQGRLTAPSGKL